MYKPALNSVISVISKIILLLISFVVVSCTSDRNIKQDKAEIAILMPMSGPYGEEGKKLAELIKFGLEDKLQGFINTTTYDVATEDFTIQATEKILAKKTNIILGPLFTPSVKSLENFVRNNDITMITLSNNPALASDKEIFVFGHGPLKQTQRLLGYLFDQGHREYVLLMPRNKHSANLVDVLKGIIATNEANVIAVEEYDNAEGIEGTVQKISTIIDAALEDVDKDNKPVILISEENSENIRRIFDEIKKYNLDTKAIIAGDSRIDIEYNNDITIVFTGSDIIESQKLNERIRNSFGARHLNYLEKLAYDLGDVSATSVGLSYSKETFLNRLESPSWFHGLSGYIRFKNNIADRDYAILQKSGNSLKILHSRDVK